MSEKLSLLERWALGYYRKWDSSLMQEQEATLSLASCHQLIRVVERRTIRHAAIAGACSGLVAGLGAFLADPLMPNGENVPMIEQLPYLSVVLAVALVATAIEIAYLYWDGLYAAVQINCIAQRCKENEPPKNKGIALIMIRSTLELPEPVEPMFGIDPLSKSSKLHILLRTIAYKAKITVTNFLLKALLKRIFGRVASRSLIELIAVPVFAIWNAVITKWIMQEGKIRALGNAIVSVVYSTLFPHLEELSTECKIACFLAIREGIMSSGEFHPNVVRFLQRFISDTGFSEDSLVSQDLQTSITRLSAEEKQLVLKVLTAICCLNGKLTRQEKKCINRTQKLIGEQPSGQLAEQYLDFVIHATPIKTP